MSTIPVRRSPDQVLLRVREPDAGTSRPTSVTSTQPEPSAALTAMERDLWDAVITRIPTRRFTLADIWAHKAVLVRRQPQIADCPEQVHRALAGLCAKGFVEMVAKRGDYRQLKEVVNPAPPLTRRPGPT